MTWDDFKQRVLDITGKPGLDYPVSVDTILEKLNESSRS